MKKILIILGIIIVSIVVVFFSVFFIVTAPKDVGEFSVNDFSEEIANVNFHTEKNYGVINDYKSAAKAGKNAIAERFGNSSGNIFEWMGCDVCYDRENDSYYIRTYHINLLILGGAYDVLIKSDGTIIAIWGED